MDKDLTELLAERKETSGRPDLVSELDREDAKTERINAYLESCVKLAGAEDTSCRDASAAPQRKEAVEEEDDDLCSARPTKNKFWRDGEEIFTDDEVDGLSTDFCVRLVYLNISKTLKRFVSCTDLYRDGGSRTLKALLRTLQYEAKQQRKPAERAGRLMANMKSLALAVDTSKGIRRLVVNQMDPHTCYVATDLLRRLCRFNGFGEYNRKYGYLDCRICVPVKLLFLGNLEIKRYEERDQEEQASTVYNVEVCHHFGSYFHEFLERLYDVCFEKLQEKFRQFREHRALSDRQWESQMERFGVSALTSLGASTSVSSQQTAHAELLDGLEVLTRRENIRTLGTAGRMNRETRLQYVKFDEKTATVTEIDPVEEVDAVFVSSFIGFRIARDGGVSMDVYSRHAIMMDVWNDDDDL